ncbi:hypothetical protein KDA82_35005, partial [Streptomyces daliensis]|nr:hypothetical protein [Streptomyces daliensis]
MTGPELTRGWRRTPLGHLVLDRLENTRATLVTEATKVDLRDLVQTGRQNERSSGRETNLAVYLTAGPNYDFVNLGTDVRVQGGPYG